MTSDSRRLLQILGATAVASLVLATLLPTKLIPRTGLGWENEHFLMYFAATTILSIASRRPLLVAFSLMACSGVLEALQGLTPDRFPDLTAALAGAAGVISAATLVMLLATLFQHAIAAWNFATHTDNLDSRSDSAGIA